MVSITRLRSLSQEHPKIRLFIYIVFAMLFLELFSQAILSFTINPVKLDRFVDLYTTDPADFNMVPHPFLGYVQNDYFEVLEDFLELRRSEDVVVVATLGGSTTKKGFPQGYPWHMENYVNGLLAQSGSSRRVQVFNFGVDGWHSIQSIQGFFLYVKLGHPDYVVIHHNHNDPPLDRFPNVHGVLSYPRIPSWQRWLVERSRTFRLMQFSYVYMYNTLRYGSHIEMGEYFTGEYGPMSRMSSYVNEPNPGPLWRDFFRETYVQKGLEDMGLSRTLSEHYASLIRYVDAVGGEVIMTTQYQNTEQMPEEVTRGEDWQWLPDMINDIIRDVSREEGAPLVDLAQLMGPYADLSTEGTHFVEEGRVLRAEFVGDKLFELIHADS